MTGRPRIHAIYAVAGDEDLFPQEGAGAWECRSCLRAFTVRMTGMIRPGGGAA